VITTHAAIEQAAFDLFEKHGFAGTTLDAIAREVGVGKRTIFRYYPSKNDIPWGQFADTLERFRRMLDDTPDDVPVHEAVHRGVLDFNRFPTDARPSHRDRMRLILTTPELRAHSVHQYAAWRAVIADYVARRRGCQPTDLEPRLAGHVSLSLALTAYELWLDSEGSDLIDMLERTMGQLRDYLDH
jgi:mycofactocin system transcriptional regulator